MCTPVTRHTLIRYSSCCHSYQCVPCHPWCTHRTSLVVKKEKTFSSFPNTLYYVNLQEYVTFCKLWLTSFITQQTVRHINCTTYLVTQHPQEHKRPCTRTPKYKCQGKVHQDLCQIMRRWNHFKPVTMGNSVLKGHYGTFFILPQICQQDSSFILMVESPKKKHTAINIT